MTRRTPIRRPWLASLRLTAIVWLMLPAVALKAQATQTATFSLSSDPTTPKATLLAMAEAIRDGNVSRIQSLVYAETPLEQQMASAMADMAQAMAALYQQSLASLGPEGTRDLIGDPAARWEQEAQRLQAATTVVDDDGTTATVSPGDGQPTLLKRIDGAWRISMAGMARGSDQSTIEARLLEISQQQRMLRELTWELSQGKYRSGHAAKQALHQKQAKWIANQTNNKRRPKPPEDAATQPATRPQ